MEINVTVEANYGWTGYLTEDVNYVLELETPTIEEVSEVIEA